MVPIKNIERMEKRHSLIEGEARYDDGLVPFLGLPKLSPL